MKPPKDRFWETRLLAELTPRQWERLCDGCGWCCVEKTRDRRGRVGFTRTACRLLDLDTCRCRRYRDRRRLAPECVILSAADLLRQRACLPTFCAYRCLAEGRPLPPWHPLLTGDRDSTRRHGMSVRGHVDPGAAVARARRSRNAKETHE